MKFLIDKTPEHVVRKMTTFPEYVIGQLLTPLTRYADAGGVYAIDNGAFSRFRESDFIALLRRQNGTRERCLFVTVVDIVANARRTLEIWKYRHEICSRALNGWPLAFVAQDGIESLEIPWNEFKCLFVGGGDPWKDSKASLDIVKTAKVLGKHVHVGRVNSFERWKRFSDIGADTCDGSGIAMYDHMLEKLAAKDRSFTEPGLFDLENLDDCEAYV